MQVVLLIDIVVPTITNSHQVDPNVHLYTYARGIRRVTCARLSVTVQMCTRVKLQYLLVPGDARRNRSRNNN